MNRVMYHKKVTVSEVALAYSLARAYQVSYVDNSGWCWASEK